MNSLSQQGSASSPMTLEEFLALLPPELAFLLRSVADPAAMKGSGRAICGPLNFGVLGRRVFIKQVVVEWGNPVPAEQSLLVVGKRRSKGGSS